MYIHGLSQLEPGSRSGPRGWFRCMLFLLAPAAIHAQPSLLLSRHHRAVVDTMLRHAIQTAPQAEQWPNQDYAVLLDIADVTVKPDGAVIAHYHQTYKLFNTRARD